MSNFIIAFMFLSLSAFGVESPKNCESINSSRENSKKELVQDAVKERTVTTIRK